MGKFAKLAACPRPRGGVEGKTDRREQSDGEGRVDVAAAARTLKRSFASLYAQMWTHLFSAPNSEYQAPTSGDSFVRSSILVDQRSIMPGIPPGARV